MNNFELEVVNALKQQGYKIIEPSPKYIDALIEMDNRKISVEIKNEEEPLNFLPKAFGQLMASKYIYGTDEQWLITSKDNLQDSDYIKVIKDNNIRIFSFKNGYLTEIKDFTPPKKDRAVRRGIDYKKLGKIWNVLTQDGSWLHIAEIARRTGINECTIRWYLDKYLKDAVEEERVGPKIKLRLIRIKPGLNLQSYLKALKYIDGIKKQ
jgi:hypothetical protein